MRALRTGLTIAGLLLLAGCAQEPGDSGVTEQDLYAVGCPVLDGAIAGSDVVRKAAVWSLDELSASATEQSQKDWLSSARTTLSATSVEDIPADVRSKVVQPCVDAGHPLTNL